GARYRVVADAGAYAGWGALLADRNTRRMSQGVYRMPRVSYDVALAATNTTPMGAYRGAGRPEAGAMVERLMDLAADELGIDPVERRRRTPMPPAEFPSRTALGTVYDTGEYERALDEALRLARYDELLEEQAARRERGDRLQLGIGVAMYVEVTGGGGEEY